jgi:predicted DNA-binding protein
MVTVATRVEPAELQRLRQLANECGLSVCAYVRELVRRELNRADRNADAYHGAANANTSRTDLDLPPASA